MAKGNLPACLAVTLPHEGGYVNHPRDPGGATNMGITHYTLAAWRGVKSVTRAQVKALTLKEATDIYEHRYWKPIQGDRLPFGVDLATFDYGVNSGTGRAEKELQRVVGAKVDGQIGPETLKAVAAHAGKAVIRGLCARRLSFMRSLKIWDTFKRGWSRRVADVEAKAVAMWMAGGSALSKADREELEAEAGKASRTAEGQNKGAQGAGGGGAAVGGGDTILNGEPNWLLIAGIAILVLIVAGILIGKSRQNRDRAEAYAAVAKAA
jgi:lysozyme family protein